MTNSGRGGESGAPRRHRRVDPDELTPDDLFRPEPSPQPYQQAQPYAQQPGSAYHMPTAQGGHGQHAAPMPGEPWHAPGQDAGPHATAPSNRRGTTDGGSAARQHGVPRARQHGGPRQGQPWDGSADAADETQVIGPFHTPSEPSTGGFKPSGKHAAPAPGDDATRRIPRIPSRPTEAPRIEPQDPPQTGSAAGSPFTIRPGLPSGAYGEEPSYTASADPAPAGPGDPHGQGHSDETQLLPPVQPDISQPQQPPYRQPQAAAYSGSPAPDPTAAPRPVPPPRSRRAAPPSSARRLSPAALAGIVVAGCALTGLIAGAALSSGGEEEDGKEPSAPQKAAATTSAAPDKADDPAKAQAKALDALLKDSNNSRAAVITAVEQIKRCQNLGGAAQSLRDAAAQRNGLISRLAGLSIDELDGHARLSAALNKAWASSASADNHYAAWADDVAGKKGCKKGQARTTAHAQQGNRSSGDATRAKREAARLWNTLAQKYGLTQRNATEL